MLCGIIDLGSNTIRLGVYQYDHHGHKKLLEQSKMAGLAGHIKNGELLESGIDLTASILNEYQALLTHFSISELYVLATASLRNISNSAQALSAIHQKSNVKIRLLSGEEEALLSFLGAVGQDGVPSGLLTDIGGGSSELVTYQDMHITHAHSCPMGSLSLFSHHVSQLFPTETEQPAIQENINELLSKSPTITTPSRHLYATGGTACSLLEFAKSNHFTVIDERSFSAETLQKIYDLLSITSQETIRNILRTVPDRLHTITTGCMILKSIVDVHKVETITVSTAGIREGFLESNLMK